MLVIEDSRAQRMMLAALLRRWGHDVVECDSALAALDVACDPSIGLIISDWMMPGLTGPDFCRRLRGMRRDGYAYVILLTSKSEEGALTEGLEAGADDFLTKPVRAPELRARLNAGARIVAMQREVMDKNRLLTDALGEIRTLYAALDQDLEEARRLQQAQMQDRFRRFGPVEVSLWLKASGPIGGDMVGCFPVNDTVIGAFGLDVSGHGVASAMIAARVSGILSAATPDQNIALTRMEDGSLRPLSPDMAAARLNKMILSEIRSDRYFTLCLGFLNLCTGRMRMVQAGHPHPLVLRADGRVETVGEGGLPIGLVREAVYSSFDVGLGSGDRMLIYSDGLTECVNAEGETLDEDGLARLVAEHADLRGPAFLGALEDGLARFAGTDTLGDDASVVVIDYVGPDRTG
ncbi:PP2C family protein-serine/threonine phosphatase [Roseicyclus mahoneyensis]|uniref:PP2C family protein-serine/threonine phosphatase n=1 Tax=Roseicyclus mahoneyensis TaxID=164332 RepID=UPI001FE8D6D2|nr:fused response regulator/phosphatase [Roseicyclus mahoneyensis]